MTSKRRTLIYAIIACVCCIISITRVRAQRCGDRMLGGCDACGSEGHCQNFPEPSPAPTVGGDLWSGCQWLDAGAGCVPICDCAECPGECCQCDLQLCCGMNIAGGVRLAGSCISSEGGSCVPTIVIYPTTASPTTASPTTASPTTESPTTSAPTTASPTTTSPTTASPTTASPTTASPTTASPTTASPTTASPTALYVAIVSSSDEESVSVSASASGDDDSDSVDAALLVGQNQMSQESYSLIPKNGNKDDHTTNVTLTLTLSGFTVWFIFGVIVIVTVCIVAIFCNVYRSSTKYEIN